MCACSSPQGRALTPRGCWNLEWHNKNIICRWRLWEQEGQPIGNRFVLILKAELSGLQFCLAIWVEGDSFAVALRWGESEGKINERGMKEI